MLNILQGARKKRRGVTNDLPKTWPKTAINFTIWDHQTLGSKVSLPALLASKLTVSYLRQPKARQKHDIGCPARVFMMAQYTLQGRDTHFRYKTFKANSPHVHM
jgi:hypothetical protein